MQSGYFLKRSLDAFERDLRLHPYYHYFACAEMYYLKIEETYDHVVKGTA